MRDLETIARRAQGPRAQRQNPSTGAGDHHAASTAVLLHDVIGAVARVCKVLQYKPAR